MRQPVRPVDLCRNGHFPVIRTQGITARILLPIVGFMAILALFAGLRSRTIIAAVMHDYHNAIIRQESDEILNIIREDLTEDQVLTVLRRHFDTENFRYRVLRGKEVVVTCCDFPVSLTAGDDGSLSAVLGERTYYGSRIPLDKYGLVADVLREYPKYWLFQRQLNSTITIFALSTGLMIVYVLLVLRWNLVGPIRKVMDRINRGEQAPLTRVRELDELGTALNQALATAELRHTQAKVLHDIAVSLNEDRTMEDIMQTIVGKSKDLIEADLSAIALYDEKGDFSKLKVSGLDMAKVLETVKRLPRGEGILKLLKLSFAPVKINDVAGHPAFSGSFPAGHPLIRNFLGYPIFSKEGRPIGALYFANKLEGDFTAEDEEMLMAVASDTAVAIQRVSDTADLSRFKKIIESSFDSIVITDREGVITYVNPAFESVTGYKRQELLGRNPGMLKSGMQEEEFYRALWQRIGSGMPWKGEFINRRKNGDLYNVSAVIFPVLSDKGTILNYVSIQRDVTEEKRLHEQLVRTQKMDAIGTMAGGISHDFNNLLAAIIGYAEMIREDLPEDHPNFRHVVIIENAAKRGSELAARIVSATKTDRVEYRSLNLDTVIKDTLELLSRSFPKNISIETRLQEGLPPIMANASQVQQVIMNLAVNARDAMPDGGRLIIQTEAPDFSVMRLHGLPAAGGFVKFSITDTGKGMDPGIVDKVFDPFFTTKAHGAGTGLGLYIVHAIVSNHGGSIHLSSEPGAGTTFHVYFPISAGVPEEEPPAVAEDLRGRGTILVIEDEEDVRSLTKDILERLGYGVLTAADGPGGIATFRARRDEIDLVLLDMIMPLMHGTEVFHILKGIDPDVRVVIVSGYSGDGFAGIERLLNNGAKQFVQKPFSQKALARAVKEAMGRP